VIDFSFEASFEEYDPRDSTDFQACEQRHIQPFPIQGNTVKLT
jgi:hypothetical protein